MTDSMLSDALAHHAWATRKILDACEPLTPEQLLMPAPGTYGPIIETLRHMVGADAFYLWILTDGRIREIDPEAGPFGIPEMREAMRVYEAEYAALLSTSTDPDADVVEHGEGFDFHATLGVRLAQVVHHGTDHRSQVCTALTSLGFTPPEIDVWAYAESAGRSRGVDLR